MKEESPIVEYVREELRSRADWQFQAFASPILRAAKPVLGVRLPLLHKMAKSLLKMDYRPFLEQATDLYYEETMLRGLLIAHASWPEEQRMARLREFVAEIGDWSVCDSTAAALKAIKANLDFYYPFLKSLAQGEGEFQIRFGLVCLMDHYLVEDWLARVLDLAAMANTETYYARMGAAWLFTTACTKFPALTLEFLKSFPLDHETAALTARKIRESRAICKAAQTEFAVLLSKC